MAAVLPPSLIALSFQALHDQPLEMNLSRTIFLLETTITTMTSNTRDRETPPTSGTRYFEGAHKPETSKIGPKGNFMLIVAAWLEG